MERSKLILALIFMLPLMALAQNPVLSAGPQLQTPALQADLSPQERSFLRQKGSVRMCVDPDWMPMEQIKDGRHEGIASDYMGIFQKKLGIPIDLVVTSNWAESIEFAQQRRCDIYSLAMSTPDRLKYMSFTQPYLRLPLVVATRKEQSFVNDVTQLTDRSLGIVSGYAFAELLRHRYPQMNIKDVDSLSKGLSMVERGELYGMIDTLASIGYQVQKGFPELKIAGKFNEHWELGVGVRNDEPLLFTAFEKAIATLDEKTAQQIINRWISVKYEQNYDYSLLWQTLGVIAFILALLFYRQSLLKKHNRELLALTETDSLTQVASRHRIDQLLLQQVENFQRYGEEHSGHLFSIIMFDLDHFKRVNDQYGHLVGDKTLVALCQRVQKRLRKVDVLGRWGGEEFIIICPSTSFDQAITLAEQLRQYIAETDFETIGQQTASFGVAAYQHKEMAPEMLISLADDALYRAKEAGRNRVQGASPQPTGTEDAMAG